MAGAPRVNPRPVVAGADPDDGVVSPPDPGLEVASDSENPVPEPGASALDVSALDASATEASTTAGGDPSPPEAASSRLDNRRETKNPPTMAATSNKEIHKTALPRVAPA